MMKSRLFLWLFLLSCPAWIWANDTDNGVAVQQLESVISPVGSLAITVNYEAPDGIYFSPEPIAFSVEGDIPAAIAGFDFICIVTTDDYLPVDSLGFRVSKMSAGEFSHRIAFIPPAAGFYRITIYAWDGKVKSPVKIFNVGYDPERIVSPTDAKPDFWEFWTKTRAELDRIPPRFKMTQLEDKSSDKKKVYHVEMYSLGDVKIEGYYAVPNNPGTHPAIIRFMGYGSNPRFPETDSLYGFCELILYTRGQGIQKATNTYGEWIVNGLKDKETYYYRGAYMDLIRGVDFLTSRPEVDPQRIVAEGGSQGGAFTLVLCALDKRIRAAAPRIPFLSDFKDYFVICPWPRSVFEKYRKENPNQSWEVIYNTLSYFDIKNFAGHINCPIIMGVGLQDDTCPPHTNFAGYNFIHADKTYIVYPEQGHSVDGSWWPLRENFLRLELGIAPRIIE